MSLFLSNSRELVIVFVIIFLNNLNPRQRGHYEGCSDVRERCGRWREVGGVAGNPISNTEVVDVAV